MKPADMVSRIAELEKEVGRLNHELVSGGHNARRDFVTEANTLLATKDAELQRLKSHRDECERQFQDKVTEVCRLETQRDGLIAIIAPFSKYADKHGIATLVGRNGAMLRPSHWLAAQAATIDAARKEGAAS